MAEATSGLRTSHTRRRALLASGGLFLVCYVALGVAVVFTHTGRLGLALGLIASSGAALLLLAWGWFEMRHERAILEELRENEARLRLLTQQAPADVWTTDADLRLTSILGALIPQLENAEARRPGRTLYELFGTRDPSHPAIAAHLQALRGESATYERADGDHMLEGRVEPLRDDRGSVVGCIGIATDVSMWRWAESQVRRFAALVQSSEDAIISTGVDGTIETWNPAAERLYGYSAAEAVGKPIAVVAPPGGEPEIERNTLALRQGVAVGPYEAQRRRRDGRMIWVSVTVSPIRDGSGRVVGMSGIVRDITDRKRAEAELARLASFPQMIPMPVVEIDTAGSVSFMNPEAERLFTDLRDAPSLHPFVAGAWVLAGESRRAGRRLHSREVRVGRKWYLQDISALPDGSHLRIYASDITERKRAEDAVRTSNTRFRELFNRMSSGVAVYEAIDDGGDFIFADFNPAAEKMEKVSREDILGKRVSEMFPGLKAFGVFEVFQRVWQTGQPEFFPGNIYRDENGLESWRESWVFRLPTREIVAIYNEITERKQAETALRALARHLDAVREEEHTRMAREIHDELAQSLTALRLDLSWLAKKVPAGGQAVRDKLAEMVVLTNATIEAGRRIASELRPPILDDLGLIAALEWFVQDFARRTNLRATLDVGPKEPAVDGPLAVTAYRIVQEALNNVVRHAEANRVTVRLGEQGGALVLEITDDGRGMHADAAVSAQSFGIVGMRERAAAHGGALEVASAPGGGTVVRATIPLERGREPREQG